MLQTDLAATILSHCTKTDLTVTELIRKISGNHDRTMTLIKELEERSLLLRESSRKHSVGRPRQYLRATPIGRQFLNEYHRLHDISIRCNEYDIRKALHQAELAQQLDASGISPYERFQEVNEIARNIKRTAKTKQNPR
jgi:predicted transcriptional regulator